MKFIEWINGTFDKKLSEQLRHSSRITLSHSERDEMRTYLARYMQMKPARAPRHDRTEHTHIVFHFSQALAALLIVIVSASTTVAAAAESALPGETLYTIKVEVNEPMRSAIALSPESKTAWAVERAERRIEELAALTKKGDVDETLREEIDERLDEHVHDAEETTSRDEPTDDVETRLVAVLRAHEALVAPMNAGGLAESDAAPTAMTTAVAVEETVSSNDSLTTLPAPTADTMAPPESTLAARSAERELISLSAETKDVAPAQEAAGLTASNAGASTAKQIAAVSSISEKALKRQQKAAQQRIEALEKLLERSEKRNNAEHTAVIRDGLTAARDAYTNATEAASIGNTIEASVLLNSAMRIAIDAREIYGETLRNVIRGERDARPETRSDEQDDDRETRDRSDRRDHEEQDD